MNLDEYSKLLKDQKGRCAICNAKKSTLNQRFHIDHDHTTRKIRGLLCYSCNAGIGLLGDSIKRLQAAISYLRSSETPTLKVINIRLLASHKGRK